MCVEVSRRHWNGSTDGGALTEDGACRYSQFELWRRWRREAEAGVERSNKHWDPPSRRRPPPAARQHNKKRGEHSVSVSVYDLPGTYAAVFAYDRSVVGCFSIQSLMIDLSWN